MLLPLPSLVTTNYTGVNHSDFQIFWGSGQKAPTNDRVHAAIYLSTYIYLLLYQQGNTFRINSLSAPVWNWHYHLRESYNKQYGVEFNATGRAPDTQIIKEVRTVGTEWQYEVSRFIFWLIEKKWTLPGGEVFQLLQFVIDIGQMSLTGTEIYKFWLHPEFSTQAVLTLPKPRNFEVKGNGNALFWKSFNFNITDWQRTKDKIMPGLSIGFIVVIIILLIIMTRKK